MLWIFIVIAVVAFVGVLVLKNNANQAIAKGGTAVCTLILLGAVAGVVMSNSNQSAAQVTNKVEKTRELLGYGAAKEFAGKDGVAFFTFCESEGSALIPERKQVFDALVKNGIPEGEITVVPGFPADVLKSDVKAFAQALKAKSTAKTIVIFGAMPTPIMRDAVSRNTSNQQEVFWLFETSANSTLPAGNKVIMGKSRQPANNEFTGDDSKDFQELFIIK